MYNVGNQFNKCAEGLDGVLNLEKALKPLNLVPVANYIKRPNKIYEA